MATPIISAITVDGKTVGPDVIRSAVESMGETFTNMQVAGAIGRAGFEPDDLWLRQEIANRLLQRVRAAGLATCPDRKVWIATEGGVMAGIEKQQQNA